MRTSVNLRLIDLPKLKEAVEKCGVSHSKLINKCLIKLFASHPGRLKLSLIPNLVEYQERGVGYKIINVDLDVDSYNLGVNFRAFSRISVSRLVTIAINTFLDRIIKEINNNLAVVHNYVEYLHDMGHNVNADLIKWHIIWFTGKKDEKKKKTPG